MLTKIYNNLDFKEPNISDYSYLNSFLAPFNNESFSCEANPITLFMWKGLYHQRVAVFDDMLFISLGEEQNIFLLPFATDMQKAVNTLKNHTDKKGVPLMFLGSEGARLNLFKEHFENDFSFEESRDDFEYVYLSEKLINLNGKKYHSKRNHISAFSRTYNWQYETLCNDNLAEVFNMADVWVDYQTKEYGYDKGVEVENASLKRLLPEMEKIGIKGGLIRVDGKVVAFTFGSPINDKVFNVQVEKALPEYRTAYSIINKEFVANELTNFEYVNREDDLGLEGLRRAKSSYQPEILLKKYLIKECR